MRHTQVVDKLLHSFIESWNDSNPASRLDSDIINIVQSHLLYAFVAGCDEVTEYIMSSMERSKTKNNTVSISHVKAIINKFNV